jgi:hypothetical protein
MNINTFMALKILLVELHWPHNSRGFVECKQLTLALANWILSTVSL